MARGCSYNCDNPPTTIKFDSDITGPGVIIGYTATAGIAVALISVHYFIAFQPVLDPFRHGDNSPSPQAPPFSPNPVDMMILRFLRRPFRTTLTVKKNSQSRWVRLDARLTKCILTMSDLQLATGLAILISGYTQLRCGISAYHWVFISRLAWFSSLTHLSCLTFLRNYLHNHSAERHWRLFFMLALVVMLATAMGPMYNSQIYGRYSHWQPQPSALTQYAICSYPAKHISTDTKGFFTTVVLLSLIVLGFVFRVIKLHKPFSTFINKGLRRPISQHTRRLLWVLMRRKSLSRGLCSLAGDILYYPLLAWFLSIRLVMDHFSSMFFEVYWLDISFAVGLVGLLVDITLFSVNLYSKDEQIDGVTDSNWSFGQIMPVILLVVPLINIVESLYPAREQQPHSSFTSSSAQNNGSFLIPITQTQSNSLSTGLDPDADYYRGSTAMAAGTVYIFICEVALSAAVILWQTLYTNDAHMSASNLGYGLLILASGLWLLILVSFPIDHVARTNGSRWPAIFLRILSILLLGGCSTFCTLSFITPIFSFQGNILL
ncbi:hypothetical protein BDV12DRAFT_181777 [Aspergillus spectabilis]